MPKPGQLAEDAIVVVHAAWQSNAGAGKGSAAQLHYQQIGQQGDAVMPWRWLVIVGACGAWLFTSSGAILINKHLLVDLQFKFPITVAWMGLLTTTLCSWIAVHLQVPRSARRALRLRQYLTQVLPTGACMAITFTAGNTAYLYLTVSFIQMLKAACPVITMLLLFALRLERAATMLVLSVLVISGGVALASWGQVNLSLVGLATMLTSVVAESVRLVLTQYLLVTGSSGMHPMEGLLYIGSACTLCLMSQAALWEWHGLLTGGQLATVGQAPLAFAAAALAGFGVNALAIVVIKLTSSLTLKVLSTVKDAALVTIGVLLLHERVSTLQLCGYLISLGGFAWYNSLQLRKTPLPSMLPSLSSKTLISAGMGEGSGLVPQATGGWGGEGKVHHKWELGAAAKKRASEEWAA